MITILTSTNKKVEIQEFINSVDRLNELVAISTDIDKNKATLIIINNTIQSTIDWFDNEPPYLFPEIDLNIENLLGLVFYKLGNHQRAFEYIKTDNAFYNHLLTATSIQFGYEISKEQIDFVKKNSAHNNAVVLNYGNLSFKIKANDVQNGYEDALKNEQENDVKLFSSKHYINFLMDSSLFKDAEKLIISVAERTTNEIESQTFNVLLVTCIKLQLSAPYNTSQLKELTILQKKCIDFYTTNEMQINAGVLMIDASEVLTMQKEYAEAKDLIGKAIVIFKDAEIEELLGEATLQRSALLYSWSKNGSPQYYKPAINSFQNALKVFKQDTHPQKYADIHHNLALIYSEIKVSDNEKPIWTAFCASSFKDALKFYTKENHPYEYAMVCHNYATALMGFPEAKLHNNLDKAFNLFDDALLIRTKENYPFERSLTLLNQLELIWLLHNENKSAELKRLDEMTAKANEIKNLVNDQDLIEKANEHIKELEKLKPILN